MSRRPVGSIRELRDGVFRVELQHGRDAVTGLPRRMSENVHGTDADAERALARMLLSIGELPAVRNLSVAAFIEDFYKPWLAGHVRRGTRAGYESKLDRHVIPKLGSVLLTELEPYVLDRWRDDLLVDLSGRSALNVYRAFYTALGRAVRWRFIRANPLDAVDPPRASVRDLETLTAKEAVAYCKAFRGHVLEPLVLIAIATGLRPCELYALTWSDVDLAGGEVRVRRGMHQRGGDVWYEDPKSSRSHRSPSLPAWAVEQLKPLRGIGPLVPDGGAPMKPAKIARFYKRVVKAAKLRYLPLRDLRHTHGTLMLEAGVDVVVVSRRLGHSTIAITDQYYLRPKRAADQLAADAFGALLGQAGSGVKSGQA